MSIQPELGRRLRALRKDRELSLSDVAGATGISTSTLSQVETGRADMTLARVVTLARFYGRSIADLLPEPSHAPFVVRASEGRHLLSSSEGIDTTLLAPAGSRAMQPVLFELAPGSETREHEPHLGESFVHVLSGRLRIDMEGAEPFELGPGDSAYYASERRHFLRNIGPGAARVIAVISPPAF